MADPEINDGPDAWNQSHVAARIVDGQPTVFLNPSLFADELSGEGLALQVATAFNAVVDIAEQSPDALHTTNATADPAVLTSQES